MDCFAISKLVGENGSVVGVDMTDNQVKLNLYLVNLSKTHTKGILFSVFIIMDTCGISLDI